MKKLLLFIVIFSVLSSISFSYCIEAQRCQCSDGTIVQYGQNCPVKERPFGGISVDPVTREFGAVWNYSSGESAQNDAEMICKESSKSKRCVSTWFSFNYYAVALSSDDKVVEFGSSDYSYDTAWKEAEKKCNKAGGVKCEVVILASNSSKPDRMLWGGLAYDPISGMRGVSWSQHTEKDASYVARNMCGKECLVAGFQSKYAAMAQSTGNNLKMGYSNKSMKEAEKEAIKECKKAFKVKSCEIVMNGMSEEDYFRK